MAGKSNRRQSGWFRNETSVRPDVVDAWQLFKSRERVKFENMRVRRLARDTDRGLFARKCNLRERAYLVAPGRCQWRRFVRRSAP